MNLIGRKKEVQLLNQINQSSSAEFVTVYGRRRIGKTHLIREYFKSQKTVQIYFSVTGIKDGKLEEQLQIFQEEIEKVFFENKRIPAINSWRSALKLLADLIKSQYEKDKTSQMVIFFDELPWLATQKSGLLQALDHVWNTEWVEIPTLRLIVCGSAASWMIDHLLKAKGGLYNRVTRKIHLFPFNLAETEEFLSAQRVKLKLDQILQIYMAIGGVAHYLKQVQPGLSAQQNISQICFSKNGFLKDEFKLLFQSLFDHSENHLKIVQAIGKKREGLTRNEIIQISGIPSGGRLAKWLEELETSGFISTSIPFGKIQKNICYRISDEYTWFYLNWIQKRPRSTQNWEKIAETPAYLAWVGFAFESVCLKHSAQIQKALNLEGLTLQAGYWRYVPAKKNLKDKGAQIDLLFDRSDKSITLVEIKYYSKEFVLDKSYAQELKRKIEIFQTQTKTKKQIFLALVSVHGMKESIWADGLVNQALAAQVLLFE